MLDTDTPGRRVWEPVLDAVTLLVLVGLLEGAGFGGKIISPSALVVVGVGVLELLGTSVRCVGDAEVERVDEVDSVAELVEVEDEVGLGESVGVTLLVFDPVGDADGVFVADGVTVALEVSEDERLGLCVAVGLGEADMELLNEGRLEPEAAAVTVVDMVPVCVALPEAPILSEGVGVGDVVFVLVAETPSTGVIVGVAERRPGEVVDAVADPVEVMVGVDVSAGVPVLELRRDGTRIHIRRQY